MIIFGKPIKKKLRNGVGTLTTEPYALIKIPIHLLQVIHVVNSSVSAALKFLYVL